MRHNASFEKTTRIQIKPRFFLILFCIFAMLATGSFLLSKAQLTRTVPEREIAVVGDPVSPVAEEKDSADDAGSSGQSSGETQDAGSEETSSDDSEEDVPSGITSVTLSDAAVYVMLDPGHGGMDGGCTYGDLKESDLNLAVALYCRDYLQSQGIGVLMTRETDVMVGESQRKGLYTRALMCNKSNAVAYVSIHANSYSGDTSVNGIDTYRNVTTNPKSENLATYVQNRVVQITGAKDRGLKEDAELVVIRETKVPSCLIEIGFVTCPAELKNLQDDSYRKKVAQGIANGIIDFLLEEGYVQEVTPAQ